MTSPVHFALRYFDPRPPCGGRLCASSSALTAQTISTHAPLAGGDDCHRTWLRTPCDFNQRPPCGGRHFHHSPALHPLDFNQRPPCGGRLSIQKPRTSRQRFQPTPPLRGGRRQTPAPGTGPYCISTNAPLAGGDGYDSLQRWLLPTFQPTPPLRGATPGSIPGWASTGNFNQRPPCGGRRAVETVIWFRQQDFNQRPPCGGRPGFCAM